MRVTFLFCDQSLDDFKSSYETEMTAIPRVDEQVLIPATEFGTPLVESKDGMDAMSAVVRHAMWMIGSGDDDSLVVLYCQIQWTEQETP